MAKPPQTDEKKTLKKGAWSPEEDRKLIAYINRYGIWNWAEMPKPAGLQRSGKSCRLRWVNYLKPGIKRGNFTSEEEETIIQLHQTYGNRWSFIASKLPARTDNEIKNYWHTHLRKRLKHSSVPTSDELQKRDSSIDKSSNNEAKQVNGSLSENDFLVVANAPRAYSNPSERFGSAPFSPQSSTITDNISRTSGSTVNINPAVGIASYNQTIEENIALPDPFSEFQGMLEHPFNVGEGSYAGENPEAEAIYAIPGTGPQIPTHGQLGFHEPICLLHHSGNDFWFNIF